MSLLDDPINKTEAAGEKAIDHLFARLNETVADVFDRIWRTRITVTVDLEERK